MCVKVWSTMVSNPHCELFQHQCTDFFFLFSVLSLSWCRFRRRVLTFPGVGLTSSAAFLVLGMCGCKNEKCSHIRPHPDVFLSSSRQTRPHTKSTPTCIISTASPLVTSPFLTSISRCNITFQMTETAKCERKKRKKL